MQIRFRTFTRFSIYFFLLLATSALSFFATQKKTKEGEKFSLIPGVSTVQADVPDPCLGICGTCGGPCNLDTESTADTACASDTADAADGGADADDA